MRAAIQALPFASGGFFAGSFWLYGCIVLWRRGARIVIVKLQRFHLDGLDWVASIGRVA